MKRIFATSIISLIFLITYGQGSADSRVKTVIDTSDADNLVLIQSMTIEAPIKNVWNAYTTSEGWENWATAKAKIDFKLGGLIQTRYDKDAQIGDEGTITLHVINYVPQRMLTIQAEISPHFPEFMKEDAKHMYNTILFEKVTAQKTKIISYGIGYKNNEKYKPLLDFFIKGNEMSSINLITYLETGKPSANY